MMNVFIRAYLRASSEDQDAFRAKKELQSFAKEKGVRIAGFYVENISGTTLERPELNRLIDDSEKNDIILIEKIDRLTRLPFKLWKELQIKIKAKGLSILVIGLPTTHIALNPGANSWMLEAINNLIIELGAEQARDDYETRRKRQSQGIQKAKNEGKYLGRKPNIEMHDNVRLLLSSGHTYSQIQSILNVSRPTIAKIAKANKV